MLESAFLRQIVCNLCSVFRLLAEIIGGVVVSGDVVPVVRWCVLGKFWPPRCQFPLRIERRVLNNDTVRPVAASAPSSSRPPVHQRYS